MIFIVSITIIGIIFFFKLLYVNFLFGEPIYLFSLEISSIALVFYFYIFLISSLFFIFNKQRDIFLEKERIVKLFILHLIVTTALVLIGEYTLSIVLQFVFLLNMFKSKDVFLWLYFLCINYTLLLLFGSSSFILYFLLLSVSTFFLFDSVISLSKGRVVLSTFLGLFFTFLYIKSEVFIYEIYIWLDIVDETNYLVIEVIFVLSFIHGIILVSTIIKNKKMSFLKKIENF